MRVFIAIVLLLAVGIGVAGFALGWFKFSGSQNEGKRDLALIVDPDVVKKDRDAVFGWFPSSTPPTDKKNTTAADAKTKKGHDDFHQQAETQFKAIDLSLDELKAKAKSGHAVTKERMNEAIDKLTKKTEATREEFRELKSATQDRWESLKTRFSASLEELNDGIEGAFARYMNEWAHHERAPFAVALLIGADAAKTDTEKLQGTWKMIAGETNGEQASDKVVKDTTVIISNGTFAIIEGGEDKGERMIYTLDPLKTPKRIHLLYCDARVQERIMQGIYLLEGDSLKICFERTGQQRPTAFATAPGSQSVLLVLKKETVRGRAHESRSVVVFLFPLDGE